jgi:nucleoside-diphosphate-sugar epimerase
MVTGIVSADWHLSHSADFEKNSAWLNACFFLFLHTLKPLMVFVTGGTGFIGTHLLRELIQRGEKVRALKRSTGKILLEEELANRVEWVEGDILDVPSLEEAMHGCNDVYHCAAVVSFNPGDRDYLTKVNVEGTANVVNASLANGIRKLVHLSSVSAIGRSKDATIVNESTEWEQNKLTTNYALSKFLAEREVWRGMAEGLNAVIVNPSFVLGSGNWDAGPPQVFKKVFEGLRAYTTGGTGLVDVEDVVKLMMLLMKSDISGERFILNAENWSFRDLFNYVAGQLGVKPPRFHANAFMNELGWRLGWLKHKLTGTPPTITRETGRISLHWSRYDNSKIVAATGYRFKPVKRTIEETAKKFLEERE